MPVTESLAIQSLKHCIAGEWKLQLEISTYPELPDVCGHIVLLLYDGDVVELPLAFKTDHCDERGREVGETHLVSEV